MRYANGAGMKTPASRVRLSIGQWSGGSGIFQTIYGWIPVTKNRSPDDEYHGAEPIHKFKAVRRTNSLKAQCNPLLYPAPLCRSIASSKNGSNVVIGGLGTTA